jgi:hypothetical protein
MFNVTGKNDVNATLFLNQALGSVNGGLIGSGLFLQKN